MTSGDPELMRVSAKIGLGTHIRRVCALLRGAPAKPALDGAEAVEAKAPVDRLRVSGLGGAIGTVAAVANFAEAEGLADIVSTATGYPEMSKGTPCAELSVELKRIARPSLVAPAGGISAMTWNIAAINNNPFEYWITHSDAAYAELMASFEAFVESPGDRDVLVRDVFSEEMFSDIRECMVAEGWSGLDEVEKIWQNYLRGRKIVSGVLKDKTLGQKRLMSMPDRYTNTITVAGSSDPVFRPTPINHSSEELGSVEQWWPLWRDFMFKLQVTVPGKDGPKSLRPCQRLQPIQKAKYPAITEEEEAVSKPLQCLCLAIYDAILVHMLKVLSPDGHWVKIKASIREATFRRKGALTSTLIRAYRDADVVFLQEAAATFLESLQKTVGKTHHVVVPADMDMQRDQNSAVLLRREAFPGGASREVTGDVVAALEATKAPVEKGDLHAVLATSASGVTFLIASFHGDTNGQATPPVVRAVNKVLAAQGDSCRLLFGLDANTYLKGDSAFYGVQDFLSELKSLGLRSCWADDQDMAECLTTCNARTYLQTQLNKALKSTEKLEKGDVNPKDFIVFRRCDYDTESVFKDNTGTGSYMEGECFPTLRFPSDHGILGATLRPA